MYYLEDLAAKYAKENLEASGSTIHVTSLKRTDNYRGKYPHAGPRPVEDEEGTVANGGDYPLTNKLDYVFFKRPMRPEEDR